MNGGRKVKSQFYSHSQIAINQNLISFHLIMIISLTDFLVLFHRTANDCWSELQAVGIGKVIIVCGREIKKKKYSFIR